MAARSLLRVGGGGGEGGTLASRILGSEFVGGRRAPPHDDPRFGYHHGTLVVRTTPPLRVRASLVPPLRLRVREVPGARGASGSTLVEVTVEHPSEYHDEYVTVTGISFHPGQSRLWVGGDGDDDGVDDGDGEASSRAGGEGGQDGTDR